MRDQFLKAVHRVAAKAGEPEMSDAAKKIAEGEKRMAAPVGQATAALKKQEAVSRQKTAAVGAGGGADTASSAIIRHEKAVISGGLAARRAR